MLPWSDCDLIYKERLWYFFLKPWSACGIYTGKIHHIFKQYCNILEQNYKFDLVYSILVNTLNLGDMMTFLITLLYVYENLWFRTHWDVNGRILRTFLLRFVHNQYCCISCEYSISDVMVSMLASSAVDSGFLHPDHVKPKTIKLVFVDFQLNTHHLGVRTKTVFVCLSRQGREPRIFWTPG